MIRLIRGDEKVIEPEIFSFPAGETNVKISPNFLIGESDVMIDFRYEKDADIITLSLVKDAIQRTYQTIKNISLFMPYVPYARQDRVCYGGESLSIRAVTDLINAMKFNHIVIVDPHSDVTTALLNNTLVIERLELIHGFWQTLKRRLVMDNVVFVSPDAGANKKTFKLSQYFSKPMIRADKIRDNNGRVTETILYADDLSNQQVWIVDDLCDGGGTFIELAKVLRAKKASKVCLAITHGIFTKGFDELSHYLDEIWTTDSRHPAAQLLSNPVVKDVYRLSDIIHLTNGDQNDN